MVARVPKEALAKGKHGGARPGAGRKPLAVRETQETNRQTILRLVADARWERIVLRAAEQAEEGDPVARAWLGSYVAGKPPDESKVEHNHTGEVGLRITPWSPAT